MTEDYVPTERDPGVHPGAPELRRLDLAAKAWSQLPRGESQVAELTELEEAVAAVLSTRFAAEHPPEHPADLLGWIAGRHAYTAGEYEGEVVGALRRMAQEAALRREEEDLEVAELDAQPYHLHHALGVVRHLASGRTVMLDGGGVYRWVTSAGAVGQVLSTEEAAVLRGLDLLPVAP
jgi:hypothetical protein